MLHKEHIFVDLRDCTLFMAKGVVFRERGVKFSKLVEWGLCFSNALEFEGVDFKIVVSTSVLPFSTDVFKKIELSFEISVLSKCQTGAAVSLFIDPLFFC